MVSTEGDIIAAVATPPGRGGVGIIRLSGPNLSGLLGQLYKGKIKPRTAVYTDFCDGHNVVIDQGLFLFFPGPHSFTGEDVIEMHGHGGPMVMEALLSRVVELGARLALPGEFSQRAFLNDKIDLAQAEAIADLIDASSQQAARSAIRSLQGEFSRRIYNLVERLIQLRIFVEAAIDFPEEEIDFLADGKILAQLEEVIIALEQVLIEATQGALLREGMTVVIAGKPNAGKSSLLNTLSGRDSAIVTDIAGTTRDVLTESIHIDGMPLHIVDTAGLRDSDDIVEQEGIRRAWREIELADRILMVVDVTNESVESAEQVWPEFFERFPEKKNLTFILNKVDVLDDIPVYQQKSFPIIPLSAKTGEGVERLKEHLKVCMGYQGVGESSFVARKRHLDALNRAGGYLYQAREQLRSARAGELAAEDLRYAQQYLGEITGEFTNDDLLGKIFSSFCIGK